MIQKNRGNSGFIILDVRTPEEFTDGHIDGAVLCNFQAPDFEKKVGELDRGKAYLVYCRSGNRSRGAVEVMVRLGFQRIYHMNEGIIAWQAKGYPLVK
jgi:rhodanese-related sulfurtransferase